MTPLLMIASETGAAVPLWMQRLFNVSQWWEVWWLLIGVTGQLIFFARWVFQWIASERRRESVVPTIFWWCSLLGASLLLIYFIGRREPVGVMGQLFGWIVYGRNLYLISVNHRRISDAAAMHADDPLPILDDASERAD
jgi:lipid-A-disaccharide synthase-like uncharacterized protein